MTDTITNEANKLYKLPGFICGACYAAEGQTVKTAAGHLLYIGYNILCAAWNGMGHGPNLRPEGCTPDRCGYSRPAYKSEAILQRDTALAERGKTRQEAEKAQRKASRTQSRQSRSKASRKVEQ